MPKAFPPEFRDEVVRVARRREQSVPQTAIDFGVSESCLNRWLTLDEIETGDRPGVTKAESAETRELKKRNKLGADPFGTLRPIEKSVKVIVVACARGPIPRPSHGGNTSLADAPSSESARWYTPGNGDTAAA